MFISVIIPTYNRNKVLCETLTHLLKQKDSNCEILVIDQTPEHDEATVRFLEGNKSQIQHWVVSSPNLPAARNFGIGKSKGETIVFLDDDVIIQQDFIERVRYEFASNANIAGLTGLAWSPDMDTEEKWNIIPNKYRRRAKTTEEFLAPTKTLPGFFMAFTRICLEDVGGFDEWIGTQPKAANEDGELCLRLVLAGYRLFISPRIEILHLAEISGGCEVRKQLETQRELVKREQTKMLLYGLIKNRSTMGNVMYWAELIRLYRSFWVSYGYSIFKIPFITRNLARMMVELKH